MKKIGFIAGAFDVIHPGYVYLFQQIKSKCDKLVIGLHDDPSIERNNKLKPVLSVFERKSILYSLRDVDLVLTYQTEDQLVDLLVYLNPDIRFLGDDYRDQPFTGKHLNIPIEYMNRDHGWSTTKFKNLIHKQFKKS